MKNITDFILEALNTLPKEFMNIWKGKPANIDPEYFDNISLLSQGVMDVHRRELPTEKEFDNLCNWMIENIKTEQDAELFLSRMIDIFMDTNKIYQHWMGDYRHGVEQGEPFTFFYYHEIKKRHEKEGVKGNIDELPKVKNMFKKWNRDGSNWPDYSKSFIKVANHFHNL